MKFSELTEQVKAWLQRQGRVSYRALKREFELDDDYLADLKAELIDAQRVAVDEDGKVLVWIGDGITGETTGETAKKGNGEKGKNAGRRTPDSGRSDGERRQLTVMFCDLVGSTALSERLDPEDYREVIQAYNEVCAAAIKRFDGHLAKYMGDGLLVYFGYPVAHEDDAQRAVRAGLEIVAALQPLSSRQMRSLSQGEKELQKLQVRIGIHTGLVVAGEMGAGETREQLAIVGETPNLAARLQALAEPNTMVISAVTHRLVRGYITCRSLGQQTLKGLSTPVKVYEVQGESRVQSRFELAVTTGLTPLVGREEELGLLEKRWKRVKKGEGQVVMLRGEAGIGKSRLARAVREWIAAEPHAWLMVHCSPYHQNSAFYPLIEVLQRALVFRPDDPPEEKLGKLGNALLRAGMNLADSVPLLASLLALPSASVASPSLSPQKQREKTLHALVSLVVQETKLRPVLFIWEDLHWADPSSLDFANLLIEQAPTARLLILLTCRPEFTPTWALRSHVTQLTLSRLGRTQVEAMIEKVSAEQALPQETIQQIVTKADGVPLFVEELTKNVIESGGATGRSPLQLGIPVTLHDALMARLDRLGEAKEIAQLGATLGREFSYELLQAVSTVNESALQQALRKLVESELLYQRGSLPQAQYVFKHALIQDTAYQSLLKITRQKYHQKIAQILEERFAETKENHPELLAHHHTEANLIEQAIPYWQQAGQRAAQRSAPVEAIAYLSKGLELLKTLSDTPERVQQELTLQISLGAPLIATKGYAAPEVENVYSRARELCRQVGETPQLFPVLWGTWGFYTARAEHREGYELAQQCLTFAQRIQDAGFLLESDVALGTTLFWRGELILSRIHLEHGVTLYDPEQYRSHTFLYGQDPGVWCRCFLASLLWVLGYPDQALKKSQEALTLAQELNHSPTLAFALYALSSVVHLFRGEWESAHEPIEALLALATEQGFPYWLAEGTFVQGSMSVEQGRVKEGIEQQRQGIATLQAIGTELNRSARLSHLAAAYGKVGQIEEGLQLLAEALALVNKTEGRFPEAELYRLKGELTLAQSSVQSLESGVQEKNQESRGKNQESENPNLQSQILDPQSEAEECFLKAIEVAQRQQAKSLELRAVMSLVRLRQYQVQHHATRNTQPNSRNKLAEAHKMLSEIYNWFTEGFDTKDLQEAKALLEDLGEMAK